MFSIFKRGNSARLEVAERTVSTIEMLGYEPPEIGMPLQEGEKLILKCLEGVVKDKEYWEFVAKAENTKRIEDRKKLYELEEIIAQIYKKTGTLLTDRPSRRTYETKD